jgi:NodT family efflux transporter outer membrane factor (OMF) lipoprotein
MNAEKARWYSGKVLLASLLLLAGCVKVGPNYARPPVDVSKNWLETKDMRVTTEPPQYRTWWEVFNDPVLNRIIEKAYRENLTLRIAAVRVVQARAQLGIAVGNLYPQVQQASGAVTYDRISARGTGLSGAGAAGLGQLSSWQDQIGLNAVWELDFWGKYRRAIESADAVLRAGIADYETAMVSLTADAAATYIQIRTLEKRLIIARDNVKTQEEGFQIAEAKYKGGLTTERDVEQARTILYNTQATIPVLEIQLRQAKNALSIMLGIPPGHLSDILQGESDIPTAPPQVAVGIPADLLRRRPDVRSAELQAMAQCAQIGVAKSELFPAFSLSGSFGYLSSNIGSAKLSDIFDWRSRIVSAGPSFQWNILNYGRIVNNVRVQDAIFQQLLIAYQNTVLQAQGEVENSLAGFLRSQDNAEMLAKTVAASKRSLDLAVLQYREGSVDFTTVLTAEQALLSAQDGFATALGNISGYLVGLYRALGGGWEIAKGQDILPADVREMMAERTNWGKLLSTSAYAPPPEPEQDVRLPDW